MSAPKKIIIISDGTGRTAKRLLDAVLAQYAGHEDEFFLADIHSGVRSEESVDEIFKPLVGDCLIIFSIISDDLRRYLHTKLHDEQYLHLNILEPMLNTMQKFLGFHPDFKPGLLQIIDDRYYSKVDAIGFTVEHDDGLGQQHKDADLVLVGLSRTCKTPVSMYMACNYGMKVANIPVVANDSARAKLLERLEGVDSVKIIGLNMRPEILASIRLERAGLFVRKSEESILNRYFDEDAVNQEVRYFLRLCSGKGWEVVNVTRRAIEEISVEILHILHGEHFDPREPMDNN